MLLVIHKRLICIQVDALSGNISDKYRSRSKYKSVSIHRAILYMHNIRTICYQCPAHFPSHCPFQHRLIGLPAVRTCSSLPENLLSTLESPFYVREYIRSAGELIPPPPPSTSPTMETVGVYVVSSSQVWCLRCMTYTGCPHFPRWDSVSVAHSGNWPAWKCRLYWLLSLPRFTSLPSSQWFPLFPNKLVLRSLSLNLP